MVSPLLDQVRARVQEQCGLLLSQIQLRDLQRITSERLRLTGLAGLEEYVNLLQCPGRGEEELLALIVELTIGETSFLRHPAHFEVLGALLPSLLQTGEPVRIWSAGCATGEEAYSLALTAAQSVPPPQWDRVTILATDINTQYLQKAEEGRYRPRAVRRLAPLTLQRFFRRLSDQSWEVGPELRRLVTFRQLNLAQPIYPSRETGTYGLHVIFCRNVLIYLDPRSLEGVVRRLAMALHPGGCLFLAPTESVRSLPVPLSLQERNGVFFSRKAETIIPTERKADRPSAIRGSIGFPAPEPSPEPSPKPSMDGLVAGAQIAMGNGATEAAVDLCQRAIQARPLDPEAYYLLGLLLLGTGAADAAVEPFKKVLCLTPEHAAARFHLARAWGQIGEDSEARQEYQLLLRQLSRESARVPMTEGEGSSGGSLDRVCEGVAGEGIRALEG
jgi:chemotaxis protein methyltransferase CheR